jgi:hypothetical protein
MANPILRCLGDGDGFAGRGVNALGDIHLDGCMLGVGVLLSGECFDVPMTVLAVVENPSFPRLAAASRPNALSD